MDLFSSGPSLKHIDNIDTFDLDLEKPALEAEVDSDGSVLDLEFHDDSESDFLAYTILLHNLHSSRLEEDERAALESLTKLQSTEYAENQPEEPRHESALLLNLPLIIQSTLDAMPHSHTQEINPALSAPLQTIAHIQTTLKSHRSLNETLQISSTTLERTKTSLKQSLTTLTTDLAINASIHHKLTLTTQSLYTSLHTSYSDQLKQLRIGLDREGRKRVELVVLEEALHSRLFILGGDMNSTSVRYESECEKCEGFEEWLKMNDTQDLGGLSETKLADMALSTQIALDAFKTLTILHTSHKASISSLAETIASLTSSISSHHTTIASLTKEITQLSRSLAHLTPSLENTLFTLESKILTRLSTKARMIVKHESNEARIEGLRVHVNLLKSEEEVYREDMFWLAGAIGKVELKIAAFENAAAARESSDDAGVIQPIVNDCVVIEHESRYMEESGVERETATNKRLIEPVCVTHRSMPELKFPSISLPSLVKYASTPIHKPAPSNARSYSLPQILQSTPTRTQPQKQHHIPTSFKWDIPSSKSTFITTMPQDTQKLAIKTLASRPTSSSSVHSFTSCISAFDVCSVTWIF